MTKQAFEAGWDAGRRQMERDWARKAAIAKANKAKEEKKEKEKEKETENRPRTPTPQYVLFLASLRALLVFPAIPLKWSMGHPLQTLKKTSVQGLILKISVDPLPSIRP